MVRLIAVAAWCLAVASALGSEQWPQFRGPRGDGQAQATSLPVRWSEQQNVRWKTAIHGRGWSSPVIWDEQIWMTTATEDGRQLFGVCVDRETGRIVHDLKVFDVAAPRAIHHTNSYASPSPAIEAGRVYLHFGSAGTACLDTATAAVLWSRRDLPCDHFRGAGSSPMLYGNLLIMHFDGFDEQYVVALDKHTGATVWKTDRQIDYGTDDGDFMKAYCTPIVIEFAGRKQLISPAAKATLAYDPATGQELWRVRYENHSATARPLFGLGLVFINTGFSKAELMAVRPDGTGDVSDTHVAWKVDRGVGSTPSSLLIGEKLYVVHDRGTAQCLDAATGRQLGEKRLGGNYSASPLYADGKLYFFDEEGKATVMRPGDELEVMGVNKLADGCMASPAAVGQSLYVRTRSSLYRLETGSLSGGD